MTHETDKIVTIPICLAPQGDVAPHSYVIQLEATVCVGCNTRKTHCSLFSKTHLKARWDRKYVTNLRPLRGPQDVMWNVPIEPLMRPDVIVPFCEECFDRVSLAHLQSPPAPATTILGSDLSTDAAAPAKGGSVKPLKRQATLDDLII